MAKTRPKKPTKAVKSTRIDRITATIIVALITTVGGIIVAWIQNTPSPTPAPPTIPSITPSPTITLFVPSVTSSPTNTPLIPTPTQVLPTSTFMPWALINNFDVLNNGAIMATLKPGETANVTAGSELTIRVKVSTDIPLQDLLFIWSICSQPGNVVEGARVTEIRYQAPNIRGTDCVRVMIKKEGIVITNTTTISVNVN